MSEKNLEKKRREASNRITDGGGEKFEKTEKRLKEKTIWLRETPGEKSSWTIRR